MFDNRIVLNDFLSEKTFGIDLFGGIILSEKIFGIDFSGGIMYMNGIWSDDIEVSIEGVK